MTLLSFVLIIIIFIIGYSFYIDSINLDLKLKKNKSGWTKDSIKVSFTAHEVACFMMKSQKSKKKLTHAECVNICMQNKEI